MSPSSPLLMSLFAMAAGGMVLAQGLGWQPEEPATDIPAASFEVERVQPHDTGDQVAADIDVLLQRPAFTPGRRPSVPAVAGTATTEEELAQADVPVPKVLGVAVSSVRAVAVVTEADGGPTRRVATGDELAGWHVVAIDRERVTFGSNAVQAVVYLKRSGDRQRVEVTPLVSEVAERDAREQSQKPEPDPLF
ncbi:hypothetical protein JL100_013605 [Skermanella mucosa]|uniref:hypothetical protein n=1 Tax=Skermanella mucosa TaxID=1789672 RepID=UPI00192C547D|nr:hypothetical protein [Skermanella mucosa]UEM23725.1 hypothetical protein JL100_013605 [Skermanella mucosa]